MRRSISAVSLGLALLSSHSWAADTASTPLRSDCSHIEEFRFPAVRTQAVGGTVVNRSSDPGSPLPGVQIEIEDLETHASLYMLSRDDGSFSFEVSSERRYRLRTCMPGFDVAEVELEVSSKAGNRALEIQLGPSEAGFATNLVVLERE